MSRRIIGLDIRNDSVSAILVQSGLKGNWIDSFERIAVSGEEDFSAAFEKIAEKMNPAGAVCIVALPAERVSFRNIAAPFKDKRKIRQMLPFELEPTLPFPVDELVIDFGMVKLPDPEPHGVLAAAVEYDRLKAIIDILTRLKAEPEIITIGGLPAALYLAGFEDVPDNYLFIDMDERRCTIFLMVSGQTAFIRSFPARPGEDGQGAAICGEIQRSLSVCGEHFQSDISPGLICVSGLGAEIGDAYDDFAKAADQILDIPARRANIVRGASALVKRASGGAFTEPGAMDMAFSLTAMETDGLKGLNFRTGPFAPRKQWAEHKNSFIKTGVLAAILAIMALALVWADSNSMEKKVAVTNSRIEEIFTSTFPGKKIVEPLHQMRTSIDKIKKPDMLPDIANKFRVVDIMNEISRLIPKEIDVELSQLVIEKGNLSISGRTDELDTVNKIEKHLEQSEFLKDVEIVINKKEKGKAVFKMKAHTPKNS